MLNIFVTVYFYSVIVMLKFSSYFQWVTDSLVFLLYDRNKCVVIIT